MLFILPVSFPNKLFQILQAVQIILCRLKNKILDRQNLDLNIAVLSVWQVNVCISHMSKKQHIKEQSKNFLVSLIRGYSKLK